MPDDTRGQAAALTASPADFAAPKIAPTAANGAFAVVFSLSFCHFLNDTMQSMVADLSADDMRLLGMYFESKPTRAHPVADPELAQVGRFVYNRGNPFSGVAACADCHGAAGHGTDRLPRPPGIGMSTGASKSAACM